ncbi:MAG: hypothetical protein ACI86M_001935, partial [Saprospiraceae bacterium]
REITSFGVSVQAKTKIQRSVHINVLFIIGLLYHNIIN